MVSISQYGFIEAGKLHIINRKRMEAEISQCKDCNVEVIIKKKGKRSSKQNRYYFGVVVEEIRLDLKRRGNRFTSEEIHEWLKIKFNASQIVIEETGEAIDFPNSTTELNKDEFSEYIEKIKEWASISLGLNIPDASTQTQFEYFNKS